MFRFLNDCQNPFQHIPVTKTHHQSKPFSEWNRIRLVLQLISYSFLLARPANSTRYKTPSDPYPETLRGIHDNLSKENLHAGVYTDYKRFGGGARTSTQDSPWLRRHDSSPRRNFGQGSQSLLNMLDRSRVSCYSCGSSIFEIMQKATDRHLFKTPQTISDTCNRGQFRPSRMGTKGCATHCLYLFTTNNIFGKNVTNTYRGCEEDLVIPNRSLIRQIKMGGGCRVITYQQLFPREISRSGSLTLCLCSKDKCNSDTKNRSTSSHFCLSTLLVYSSVLFAFTLA